MKKKRLLWALPAAALLLLTALLAAVPLIVAVPPVQNYIITAAEQVLAEQLGAEVHIGAVGATPQGTIRVSDARILDRGGEPDSLTFGSVRASVSITRLLSRTVQVPVIVADDVNATLTRYENGRLGPFDFPPGDSATGAASPWAIDLGVLTITGGTVAYRDAPNALSVSLREIHGLCRFVRLDSLALDLEGRDGSAHFDSRALDSLALRFAGTVSGQAMRLRSARINVEGAHLSLEGIFPFSPDTRMGIDCHATVRHRTLAPLHPQLAFLPPDGQSELDIELRGALSSPAIDLMLRSTDLRWRDFSASSLSCSASYDGASTARAEITLTTHGRGTIAGRVSARTDSLFAAPSLRSYDIALEGTHLDVPWIARVAGLESAAPPCRCRLVLTATGNRIDSIPRTARARITADLRRLSSRAPTRIDAALDLDRGGWETSMDWGRNTVRGDGTVSIRDGVQGNARLVIGDPSSVVSLFAPDTVLGSAAASVSFHAGYDGDITAEAMVTADSLSWRSAVLDSLRAGVVYRDGETELEHATALGTAHLRDVLSRFDLDGAGGDVMFRVCGHGPVVSPTATLAVESPSLTIDSAGTYEAACSVTVAHDTLRWHACTLRDSLLEVSARGSLALPTLFLDGEFRAGPRNSDSRAHLAIRGTAAPDSLDLALTLRELTVPMASVWFPDRRLPRGAVAADIGITGALSNPTVQAALHAPSLTLDTGPTLSLHVAAALQDSLLNAELNAAIVDTQGQLRVEARLPLRPAEGWHMDWSRPESPAVSWRTDTLACAVFSPVLPATIAMSGIANSSGALQGRSGEWQLDGDIMVSNARIAHTGEGILLDSVTVRASAHGTLRTPRGAFVCTTGTLSYKRADQSVTSITARGRIDADALTLDTLYARIENGGVSVRGRMPFGTGGADGTREVPVDAECVIERFPLVVASPFVSGAAIEDGELSGEAQVRYAGSEAHMAGQLRVDGLMADVPDIEPRIGPLSVRVRLGGDTVFVDTLEAKLDKHALRGRGWAVLPREGALPLHMRLEGAGVSFAYKDQIDVEMDSAAFELNGEAVPYRLDGRLVLDRSTYSRPVRLTDLTSFIRNSSVAAPRPDADSVWRTIRLNVRLRTSSPLVVDFDIARARATAEVLVQGTPAEPRLGGTVRVVDGYVWYLDRKFAIERGVFQQSDPARLNPMLDVLAKTELSPSMGLKSATRYKVHLRVSGTLDNPTVDLQSEPSLSQIDIVSLLTLGRVRNADEEALALETGSDLTDALAEKAKVIASQQLAGYVTRRIERWLNLDQVSIEGNIFGVGGSGGPRLSVSKQVRDRLTLTYQSVIGNVEEQTIKASLKLAPHLYLEGETDAQDNAGLDLKLKWSL